MPWETIAGALPECSVLAIVSGFLVFILRRETAEKTYWRDKAIELLDLGESTAEVAADLVGENP